MKKIIISIFLLFYSLMSIYAGGEQEGAATATHGKYLAGKGIIVQPEAVHVNGYIAQIDYNYALPQDDDFAIYVFNGNRQLSNNGQNEIIHIGIKANKTAFAELPPLNLAFVIDRSGSMNSAEKIDWVKESFRIFINKVRDIDYVSLIVFSDQSEVLYPSTKMDSPARRAEFLKAVEGIEAGGGTNLRAGLENGYSQVFANYRSDYNNRVLFLTDGVGQKEGILEMASTFSDMGINLSTIGVGTDFDVNLMVELAKSGEGSSRFISDREEMKETFGDELDRMIVPAARNIKMRIEVPDFVTVNETWGYRNEKIPGGVRYDLPTLHNGDYETILAEIALAPIELTGKREIARFYVEYDDLEGTHVVREPVPIVVELVDQNFPVYGISNYTVLQSSTMLYIARTMIRIGELYYGSQDGGEFPGPLQEALDLAIEARKYILNNRMKLDNIGFDDELQIIEKYIEILGDDLDVTADNIVRIKADTEILPPVPDRSVYSHLDGLFNEINLSLNLGRKATMIVTPFIQQNVESSGLTELLNQTAMNALAENDDITLLDRSNFDKILDEQRLSLSGLMDTDKALEVGQLLAAEYMITGNIIPMKKTVVVFSKVLNITSGEVETVSQVIIPMSEDLIMLIKPDRV